MHGKSMVSQCVQIPCTEANGVAFLAPAFPEMSSNLQSRQKMTHPVQCGAAALHHITMDMDIAIQFEHHGFFFCPPPLKRILLLKQDPL